MAVKIICINKDNGQHLDPHEGITHLRWENESSGETGKSTRMEMVRFIENDKGSAYVKDRYGNKVFLVVRVSRFGTKYVKTIANGVETDNLLYLEECRV